MTNTMAMFLYLLFQIFFIICITSYTPEDHFAVNCGSAGNSPSIDNREWTGDIDKREFFPIEDSNNKLSVGAKAPAGKAIPYSTARLSRSEFSYSFPVTDGQMFIHLYFYPSSYAVNFLRSDSLFSIRAGSHTLLKDFNASFAADNAGQETILREYCVNVSPDENLSLTITP
ncbi:receptor-like protein kinase FERONIA, partial [Neltuma alba]|uniref:receptor-like protein kinase FERONIA n=1 Tax=Neltuma alba TaxID=207710 RepID=UPI0010A440F9